MKEFFQELKNKKTFLKFFISYIIIFSIPFSAIIFTYFSAHKTIRTAIIHSSSNTLYQFFNVVDSRLEEMTKINMSILNSYFAKQYSYYSQEELTTPRFDTYQLNQFLKSFQRNDIDDIFIYYPYLNTIIGIKSGLDTRAYYETYYSDTLDYSQFLDIFEHTDRSLKPTLLTLNSDTKDASLAVLVSQKYPGAQKFSSLVTFSKNTLNLMFESANFHNNSILMIFDGKDELLASSKNSIPNFNLSSYKGGDVLYSDTFGAEKYIIQVFSSNVVDCIYVSAIPAKAFWSELIHLRLIVVISILLCMLFSFITAFFLARQNYSPITSILRTISSKSSYSYDNENNEMDFISNVLQNFMEEINYLTHQLDTKTEKQREEFLLNALQGHNLHIDSNQDDIFLQNHITLLSDCFGVLLFYVNKVDTDNKEDNSNLLSFILSNVSQELCAVKHQGFLVKVLPNQYACIINFNRESKDKDCLDYMRTVGEQCSSFLKNYYGIYMSVSLSDIHFGLSEIHTAYDEATHAMKYVFQYGKNTIIPYSLTRQKTFFYDNSIDSKSAQILMEYIKMKKTGSTSQDILDKLLSLSKINENSSLEALEFFCYDTINSLNKIIHESGYKVSERMDAYLEQLMNAETFFEFSNNLVHILDSLQQRISKSKESNTICDKAEQYIDKHYTNPELNNSTLGELLNISPAYLSKMFRNQKGITLLDYLYKIRIIKAKELLSTSDYTIEDISAQVGFLSSSTFIKTFKKIEGITPGTYRSLNPPYGGDIKLM